MKFLRHLAIAMMSIVLVGISQAQQDVRLTSTGYYRDLARSVFWNQSGPPGLTNNYIFTPTTPATGVCLYLRNSDNVSRSVNVVIAITGDQNPIAFQGNSGQWQTISQSIGDVLVPATGGASVFTNISGAAQVAVVLTGTGATATASAFIVLTNSGACGFIPDPFTVFLRQWADRSFQFTMAYTANACVTNPTAGQDILSLQSITGTVIRGVYLDKLWITSSAAGRVDFDAISTAGTTCTTVTPQSGSKGQSVGSGLLTKTETCVADPTVAAVLVPTFVAASDAKEIDLSGFYDAFTVDLGTTHGLYMVTPPANITGVVCAQLQWAEVQ